jgi:hypothetical protein
MAKTILEINFSYDGPEFAGVYLFENENSLNNYLDGSIVDQVKQHPAVSNIRAKAFGVVEQPSAVTRGPV